MTHLGQPERLLVRCPYCGEEVETLIESDVYGEMIQDCEVCCSPWLVHVHRDSDQPRITAKRLDD